jgi:arylsulfatase A-like enzyme
VHFPLYPSDQFRGKSKNGLFGDWVEEVDWSVGQVLAAIRELQLDKNTFVLFTSDNGGTPRSVNAPLRGFKASTWEGGMRVPTIAWWPGQIPAGTSTDEITSMMDVLPTFAALAGGKLPGRRIDGKNLWPMLKGDSARSPHDSFYYFRGLQLEAVRQGRWKLQIAGGNLPNGTAKKANTKAATEPFPRLYDLEADVGESQNMAPNHPDVVARLQQLAEAMQNDLGTDGLGPACRTMGRVKEPLPLIGHDGKIRKGFE